MNDIILALQLSDFILDPFARQVPPLTIQLGSIIRLACLGLYDWDRTLGIIREHTFGNIQLATFAWNLPLGGVRPGNSFVDFCFAMFFLKRSLGDVRGPVFE